MTDQNTNPIKARYFKRQMARASESAALFDTLIVYFVISTVIGIVIDVISIFIDVPTMGDNPSEIAKLNAIRWLFTSAAVIYFVNVCLLMSPWKATIGMKIDGIYLETSDGSRPSLIQTLKFFFLSPVYMPLVYITAYLWCVNILLDFYTSVTAGIFYFSGTAILITLYTLIFGNVLNARQKLTGLTTKFTNKRAEKLDKKFVRKEQFLRRWLTPLTYIDRGILTIYLAAFLFFPILLALNYVIRPSFDYSLYKPYEIDWGNDNAFFALNGLTAPENIRNSYEYGKSLAYKDFKTLEFLKKEAKIPYNFPAPSAKNFQQYEFDKSALMFKRLKGTGDIEKNFECMFDLNEAGPTQECATSADIETAINKNNILWERFNKLPDYKKFSTPPQKPDFLDLDKYMTLPHGKGHFITGDVLFETFPFDNDSLVDLATLKAAQISLMQQQGKSEAALKEWLKFMKLYNQMIESRTTTIRKGIFMIVHGVHGRALETLLYNDPQLAQNHFDEIMTAIKPKGLNMFNASLLLSDNHMSYEPAFLYETGSSTGIQNKIYKCMPKAQRLTDLTAKEFSKINLEKICPDIQVTDPWSLTSPTLKTPGNPIKNGIWGIMYGSNLSGASLIGNMHIADAKMRMMVLGTQILSQNIPADKIEEFVRSTSPELQNPITELSFGWNENSTYIWFDTPDKNMKKQIFRLNIVK